MEEKKVKLEMEFDRDDVVGTFMMMGEKLTEDRWEKLTSKPIAIDCSIAGKDATAMKIAIISLMIASLRLE